MHEHASGHGIDLDGQNAWQRADRRPHTIGDLRIALQHVTTSAEAAGKPMQSIHADIFPARHDFRVTPMEILRQKLSHLVEPRAGGSSHETRDLFTSR
jgi:hypothetical protein